MEHYFKLPRDFSSPEFLGPAYGLNNSFHRRCCMQSKRIRNCDNVHVLIVQCYHPTFIEGKVTMLSCS
jgi:hypothetical protein